MSELTINDGIIKSSTGVVGYADYGKNYVYICFYNGKLVVAEFNNLDSVLCRLVHEKVMDSYYYAFKIICENATAVVKWVNDDVVLIGLMAGYYANGERIWTPSENINWPGLKE